MKFHKTMGAVAVSGVMALSLAACGNESAVGSGPPAGDGATEGAFGEVVAALQRAEVRMCEPAEGGAYIPLPAPSDPTARELSYFRYVEGRIYEFGPCQLPPGGRNELRAFRYPDTASRDTALTDVSRRNTRPTSTFVFRDVYALEIWSPEPALDSPAGQVAALVHTTLARVPQAQHHDVPVAGNTSANLSSGTVSNCPADAPSAAPDVLIAVFSYCQPSVTVPVGTEVRWTNRDAAPHSATSTSPDVPFDTGPLAQGQSAAIRFDRPGTYEYLCSIHPAMRGTVTVR